MILEALLTLMTMAISPGASAGLLQSGHQERTGFFLFKETLDHSPCMIQGITGQNPPILVIVILRTQYCVQLTSNCQVVNLLLCGYSRRSVAFWQDRGGKGDSPLNPMRPHRGSAILKPPAQARAPVTVSDALDRWISIRGRKWSPKHRANIERCAKAWLDILPPLPVSELSSLHVEELYAARDDGSRSGFTLNAERKYWRTFWHWVTAHNLVSHDPNFAWPRQQEIIQRQYHTISRDWEERLYAALDIPCRDGMKARARLAVKKFICLAICTALRKGTIRQLRWKHLSPEGILYVPAEIIKTRKEHRMPLPTRVLKMLGERGQDDDPLIPHIPKHIGSTMKSAARRAGLDPGKIYPHQCRRSFVGRLHDQGVPLGQVMKLGAWGSFGMILKYYYAGIPEEKAREILEKI